MLWYLATGSRNYHKLCLSGIHLLCAYIVYFRTAASLEVLTSSSILSHLDFTLLLIFIPLIRKLLHSVLLSILVFWQHTVIFWCFDLHTISSYSSNLTHLQFLAIVCFSDSSSHPKFWLYPVFWHIQIFGYTLGSPIYFGYTLYIFLLNVLTISSTLAKPKLDHFSFEPTEFIDPRYLWIVVCAPYCIHSLIYHYTMYFRLHNFN